MLADFWLALTSLATPPILSLLAVIFFGCAVAYVKER